MKAEEVLERYREGERDFCRENLKGQSFKGKDLSGADFTQADIRGVDFTNAILIGTDFRGALAGQKRRWTIGLIVVSWLLSGLSGIFSLLIASILVNLLKSTGNTATDHEYFISGVFSLFALASFFIVTVRKGLAAGLVAVAGAVVVAVAVAGAVVVAVAVAGAVTFAGAVAFALLGAYIGWRGLERDENHAWVRPFAIAFAATGGTSFHGADLTNANFTGASLKSTDFREATLNRTRFYKAQKLDYARLGSSILANQAVLKLLVHCNGRKQSYSNANLRGANLVGADLTEANLKNANINEATFEGASLDWANLTLAQAVGTNFAMARMTGACIEAWNIESTTVLDHVDCRFIYLLEKSKLGTDDRERRPNSGEFAPGEFTKLFEEVLDTVDFIFRNGIDWKAFVAAFKKVQVENEDTELTIQSIENKGDGVVIVKVAVHL